MATNRIKLRIAGQNPLGGRQPGETFAVATDGDGVPLDRFWRDRLAEGARRAAACRDAAVVVVPSDPAPAAAPPAAAQPSASPAKPSGKAAKTAPPPPE